MKNSPTEVKKKETEERKRQEELEKQKRNETFTGSPGGSQNDSDTDNDSSNIQQLENYSSANGNKILESLKLPVRKTEKMGKPSIARGK